MSCNPGSPCYSHSLAGKVIQGRSVPGYDVIRDPYAIGSDPGYSDMVVGNGATHVPMGAMPRNNTVQFGPGVRLEDGVEPPWYTRPIFIFLFGAVAGFIFATFVMTPGGREVSSAAAARTAKRIREGKKRQERKAISYY